MAANRIFARFRDLVDIRLPRPAAAWLRLNPDGSVSERNASQTLADLGGVATTDGRLGDARPASDVAAWAKAPSKPSYTPAEVGAATTAQGALADTAIQPGNPALTDARPASDVPAWAKAPAKPSYTPAEVGAATAAQGALADTAIQPGNPALTDARPASDVSAWAKQPAKPSYTPAEVGAIPAPITRTAEQGPPEDATAATGWIQVDSATAANGQTFSIGGVPFTCRVINTPGDGNIFYDSPEFVTSLAGKMATAINDHPLSPVTAERVGSTVNLTAKDAGPEGNAITLTQPPFNAFAGITMSGPTLTGGAGTIGVLGQECIVGGAQTYICVSQSPAQWKSTKDGTATAAQGALADTAIQPGNPALTDSRPASDVSAWAKEPTKPTYTAAEVGAATAAQGVLATAALPATNGTIINPTEGVVTIGNSGTAQTIALTSGTFQTVTLTGNCTFTMPTATAGKSFMLKILTGAGGFTGTFTGVKWPAATAPTITATASKYDLISFVADGTAWSGSAIQNFTP